MLDALTSEQKICVLRMIESGYSWSAISKKFGIKYHSLRMQCDPAYVEYRRIKDREYRDRTFRDKKNYQLLHTNGRPTVIPESTLAARDRRFALRPRDLTAAICGDPLPGMSALDRRQPA